MTARTTTVGQSKVGIRALIATAAATAAIIGSSALWQARPEISGTTATVVDSTVQSSTGEGTAARGGMAELYQDQERAVSARSETGAPAMGGMAERFALQDAHAATPPVAPVEARGGMAELYGAQEARAQADAEQAARMGGMAELYRDQARAQGGGR